MILLAMFLGTAVMPPTFAHIAAENSIVPSLPNAQELVSQGRTLYEAEQFNDAAKVLQQAAAAYNAQGDGLQQAMTLSNLSLAYQKLGQWSQATEAIAQSLNLLKTGQNLGIASERAQILAQALARLYPFTWRNPGYELAVGWQRTLLANSSVTVSILLKEAPLQKGQMLRLPPEFLIKRALLSPIVRNPPYLYDI